MLTVLKSYQETGFLAAVGRRSACTLVGQVSWAKWRPPPVGGASAPGAPSGDRAHACLPWQRLVWTLKGLWVGDEGRAESVFRRVAGQITDRLCP